ncbi:MAG TPA: condensation domain-containing protein, partial [Longimicrobium sp.]|nr:condensation domain-containing protein [Longimicrobium sp.]
TPFAEWARRLAAHAASGAPRGEEASWTGPERMRARPLPRIAAPGRNTGLAARTLEQSLDAGETRRLLKRVAPACEAQVNDVLLAALAPALAAWAGGPVAVDMEGHGREDLFPELDLSRTVGWFTAIHPVVLERGEADEDPRAAVRRVRDLLRAVPEGGIGYGLLRFAPDGAAPSPRLAAIPPADALFHYAGVMAPGTAGAGLFGRPLAGPTGPAQDPEDERPHLVEISCAVQDGRLHATWRWAGEVLDGDAVAAAADAFLRRLRALVRSLGAGPAAPLPMMSACTGCHGTDDDRPASCPGLCGLAVPFGEADFAAPLGDPVPGR